LKIAIIGAGAAGCFAAANIPYAPGREVVLFEKTGKVLQKVKVSGGGRCNTTHACFDVPELVTKYPRGRQLLKKSLYSFTPQHTIDWFGKRGVTLKTEADGRMFPTSDSSHTIIECLIKTARNLNIEIRTSVHVDSFEKTDDAFHVKIINGEPILTDRLLIATGGYPRAESFDWLEEHRHVIVPPLPSLFTFNTPDNYLLPLAGVAVKDALVKISGTKHEWRGPLLITHWGFSGPAVLKLSAWGARDLAEKGYHFTCRINWLPEMKEQEVRDFLLAEKTNTSKQQIASHARFGLPSRLWKAFTEKAEIPDTLRWGDAGHKVLNRMVELLTNSQHEVKGKTTFKEEFVTCGGVALADIDPETLQSRSVPGLFFAGEVMDVDGITGGFNFQNAWTTGYIVGKNIGR